MSRDNLTLPARLPRGDPENLARLNAVSDWLQANYRRAWREYVGEHQGEIPARGPRGSKRNRKRAGAFSRLWHAFMRERRERWKREV